jgi:hypothetical protein
MGPLGNGALVGCWFTLCVDYYFSMSQFHMNVVFLLPKIILFPKEKKKKPILELHIVVSVNLLACN